MGDTPKDKVGQAVQQILLSLRLQGNSGGWWRVVSRCAYHFSKPTARAQLHAVGVGVKAGTLFQVDASTEPMVSWHPTSIFRATAEVWVPVTRVYGDQAYAGSWFRVAVLRHGSSGASSPVDVERFTTESEPASDALVQQLEAKQQEHLDRIRAELVAVRQAEMRAEEERQAKLAEEKAYLDALSYYTGRTYRDAVAHIAKMPTPGLHDSEHSTVSVCPQTVSLLDRQGQCHWVLAQATASYVHDDAEDGYSAHFHQEVGELWFLPSISLGPVYRADWHTRRYNSRYGDNVSTTGDRLSRASVAFDRSIPYLTLPGGARITLYSCDSSDAEFLFTQLLAHLDKNTAMLVLFYLLFDAQQHTKIWGV